MLPTNSSFWELASDSDPDRINDVKASAVLKTVFRAMDSAVSQRLTKELDSLDITVTGCECLLAVPGTLPSSPRGFYFVVQGTPKKGPLNLESPDNAGFLQTLFGVLRRVFDEAHYLLKYEPMGFVTLAHGNIAVDVIPALCLDAATLLLLAPEMPNTPENPFLRMSAVLFESHWLVLVHCNSNATLLVGMANRLMRRDPMFPLLKDVPGHLMYTAAIAATNQLTDSGIIHDFLRSMLVLLKKFQKLLQDDSDPRLVSPVYFARPFSCALTEEVRQQLANWAATWCIRIESTRVVHPKNPKNPGNTGNTGHVDYKSDEAKARQKAANDSLETVFATMNNLLL